MEEDIENALNNLWNSLDDESFNITYSQEQMQEDLRLILNRYNYLDSKAENLINKNKELETMVELMAEAIHDYEDWTDTACNIMDCPNTPHCKAETKEQELNCIIDYFRKKAKGE